MRSYCDKGVATSRIMATSGNMPTTAKHRANTAEGRRDTPGRPDPPQVMGLSTHILTHKETADEASRYILRLRCSGFRVGVTVALSRLWQVCNHEDLDPRCGLQR